MEWWARIRRRFAVLLHRDRYDCELEEEMRGHLEMQAEENRQAGMDPASARHAARRQFGNATRLKEASRETWGWGWMEQFAQDLAYGIRVLRKDPGFTAIVVAVLALGSGANTAIFTVVNALLLRPLPFRDAGQLAYLTEMNPQKGIEGGWVASGNYLAWRERSHLMQDIGAFVSTRAILTGAGDPAQLNAVRATASLLTTLAIHPILGRPFLPEEDQPGRNAVVLLSENLWRNRFGARRDILGQKVMLNSTPHTVLGVVSCDVRLDAEPWDVWMPLGLGPEDRENHSGFDLFAIGRMKPGVMLDQARKEMGAIGDSIYRVHPEMSGWEVVTERLNDRLVRRTRPQLLLLSAAVVLLLLVACVNVANLLLARSAQRGREFAVRAALGAGRWRIIRQLLTESLVLSLLAGAAGLLLAHWAITLLYGWIPEQLQTGARPAIDVRVLVFTLLVSAATGVLFGLAPAFRAARLDLAESLKEAGRSIASGRGRLSAALLISEAALAVVLLTGAGLLIRSFARLLSVDPGFRPEKLLTFKVPLASGKYSDKERVAFYEELLRRLQALPGVRSAAGAEVLPIEGGGANIEFAVEGRPWHGSGDFVGTRIVTPGYFEAMGIPLEKGRNFDAHDDSTVPEVAVINETMASAYWPGEDPVGKRFRLNPRSGRSWITVVGVIHDVKHFGLDGKRWPEAYFAERQRGWPNMRVVVRTTADPQALMPVIRTTLRRIDPNIPVAEVRSMEKIVADSVAPRRLSMVLVTSFAGLALLLASIGTYGVISNSVVERRHELGIRMALGAEPGDLLRLVIARGALLTLAGLAAGMAVSLALTRLASGMLFDVTFLDPLTYAGVAVVVLTSASAAAYIPARRVIKLHPTEALRYE
ncbi:MAG: ABC transporter permease [Acidobacteria bacterium]|nr:ABC transporter permease [Acidobacteriota bacterium]